MTVMNPKTPSANPYPFISKSPFSLTSLLPNSLSSPRRHWRLLLPPLLPLTETSPFLLSPSLSNLSSPVLFLILYSFRGSVSPVAVSASFLHLLSPSPKPAPSSSPLRQSRLLLSLSASRDSPRSSNKLDSKQNFCFLAIGTPEERRIWIY
ncbi:hypothetical protein AHAS_Ahas17G0106100 [Arachis hypogaea]